MKNIHFSSLEKAKRTFVENLHPIQGNYERPTKWAPPSELMQVEDKLGWSGVSDENDAKGAGHTNKP